jgi:hypothetical protein
VCDEDTKDFLDLRGVVGASIIEQRVAIVLCVGAKMVGIFL